MEEIKRGDYTTIEGYIVALEEQNKQLKDDFKDLKQENDELNSYYDCLKEDNYDLKEEILRLQNTAKNSVDSWIAERQDYKNLKTKVTQLSEECDYLKRVINLQLTRDVKVWRLEDISNTKPITLKLQENIGNEIIVRIERG